MTERRVDGGRALHVLFVGDRAAPAVGAPMAADMRTIARALVRAGHHVTVFGWYDTTERDDGVQVIPHVIPHASEGASPVDARRALRAQIVALHAAAPIDVIEWNDAAEWFIEPVIGVADVVRLYGYHVRASDAPPRDWLSRVQTWMAVSPRALEETVAYTGIAADHTAIVPVAIDIAQWQRAADNAAVHAARTNADANACILVSPTQTAAAASVLAAVRDAVVAVYPGVSFVDVAAQTDATLAAELRRATLLLSLGDDDPSARLLLAAQAVGVPVVGSTRGDAREVIRHGTTGLLADATKPDDIARQILAVLRSARLRDKLGAAGQARVRQEHDVAMVVDARMTVYERAIAAAQQRAAHDATARWTPERDGFVFAAPHSRTGYGVVGSHLLRALQRRGIPVAFRPIGAVDRTLLSNPVLDEALAAQQTIARHVPSVRLSQQFDLTDHVGDGPRVGFTIFERDAFTADERAQLQAQDALLVCTEWAREVCHRDGITVPMHVVPLGVDRTVFHEAVTRPAPSGDTVFMQVGKLEVRKGQFELLCAFEEAFTPDDAVQLVLHCFNPFMTHDEFAHMAAPFRASPMRDRITLVTTELPSAHDVASLMATADCGVFAVRAEGWNLEALEMLSLGKAVIATHVTAHTAFLSAANARLIRIDRTEPAMGGTQTGAWAAWDISQHVQLVAHLRDVHVARQAGTLTRNEAGIATARRFSWEAAADALLRALRA